ncbi:hypothetical protein SAMN05216202_4953 [Pseudomonas mucidolens]|uniref:Uncharacterized protein n=1 Tax=Pseudomonas mucidolens TaxID=46679 RepID=A0A1H2NXJ2_9PSED|nr:hypothetical protein SAMN05216202_4953 [Pseudomonas mucidolens]SQH37177.1 Uncharacterised protein [Pseudomonas mucidolens]
MEFLLYLALDAYAGGARRAVRRGLELFNLMPSL